LYGGHSGEDFRALLDSAGRKPQPFALENLRMITNFPRWTPPEDEILRSTKGSLAAVGELLPGRTYQGIKYRRRMLGLTPALFSWTKREDKRLLKHSREPIAVLAKHFKNRTPCAIRARRKALGLPMRPPNHSWFSSEIKRLESLYPTASREELIAALPRHIWFSIKKRARATGLMRIVQRRFAPPESLHEQVRQRAREDGIAIAKLGAQTKNGSYFLRPPVFENYNKIARAVEFFGGRLVIDWQDL
jgi:hypothetical protein